MKILFTIFTSLLILTSSFAQNYKKVKIEINSQQELNQLMSLGMEYDHPAFSEDKGIEVFLNENDFRILQASNFSYEILINNWQEYYNNLPKLSASEKLSFKQESKMNFNVSGFDFGSMGGFYTYQEVMDNLDSMFAQYPDIITEKYSIGTTHEGRTIWAVKISDNPEVSENEPQVGFDALIHAREPASMATQMYFIWYLLENYGTDPEVTYLVNNREIYCIPVFNVDGYEYNRINNPNGGGMWRKNRRDNGGCYGVDLNRNYSYQWAYDNEGSSNNPCDETYRGPLAISEPETEAVTDLIIGKQINTYFNMHAYGNYFLYPWGYINQACPDEDIYIDFCTDLEDANGFDWGTGGQLLGYNSNGSARDWLYGEQTVKNKIFGYTMEIGTSSDGFWPQQSRIFPIVENSLKALIYNTWVAGEFVSLSNPNFNLEFFNAGDNVEMNADLRNKGLADAENVTVELTSSSSFINITNGTANIGTVPSLQTISLADPFTFTISGSTPVEETIDLVLTTRTGNTVMASDTLSIIIGTPNLVFADSTNNINELWTITSNTSKQWETTLFYYHTPPNSYTDSKTGNYENDSDVRLTLTNPIDLSDYSNPKLTFWTKFEIESNWDYAQVLVSTDNGNNWNPLEGNYTDIGEGDFQPNGEPLYDGTEADWVKEEMDLAGYTGEQVKFRFQLRSDGFVTQDGWYIDDIGVVVYSNVPVELTSFTANKVDENVVLKWQTASELNNHRFEIERAIDTGNEKLDFITIGFVEGKGTIEETTNYSFKDIKPVSGDLYYRLKQIDFNGSFSYSEIVEVNNWASINYSLEQNYPNPFNPITKINYAIPKTGFVKLKVFDVLGNEVAILVNEQKEAGKYSVDFRGEDLSSGLYFYSIKVNDFQSTRKMILMK